MSTSHFRFRSVWPLVLVWAACQAGIAHADIYADVQKLVQDGKAAQAVTLAQTYSTDHPNDAQIRFLLGTVQSDSGDKAAAMQTFERMNQEFPELPEPYNNLAVLLAAKGEYDKARAALELAVRLNPQYAIALENLGDVYVRLAAQAYGQSVQADALHSGAAPKLVLVRELLSPAKAPSKAP